MNEISPMNLFLERVFFLTHPVPRVPNMISATFPSSEDAGLSQRCYVSRFSRCISTPFTSKQTKVARYLPVDINLYSCYTIHSVSVPLRIKNNHRAGTGYVWSGYDCVTSAIQLPIDTVAAPHPNNQPH